MGIFSWKFRLYISLLSYSNYFDLGLLKKISLDKHEYFLRPLGSSSSVVGTCIHYLMEKYKCEV